METLIEYHNNNGLSDSQSEHSLFVQIPASQEVIEASPQVHSIDPKVSFLSTFSDVKTVANDEDFCSESNEILWFRRAFFLILIVTCASVTLLVGFCVRNMQLAQFEVKYFDYTSKFEEQVQKEIKNTLFSAYSFSNVFTSRYSSTNPWPNVTLPGFFQIARGQLLVSNSKFINFAPLIYNETTRLPWESYAAANTHLLDNHESFLSGECKNDNCDNNQWEVSGGIYERLNGTSIYSHGYRNGSRYPSVLFPLWQSAEKGFPIRMWNEKSNNYTSHILDDLIFYGTNVVTRPKVNRFGDLISVLYYPIFDHFNRSNVVGIINFVLDWKIILSNMLPGYVNGICCVLRVSTGENFTFFVKGGKAEFLGTGDFHNTNFDEYEEVVNASFGSITPIDDDLLTFSLYMYPSEKFMSDYRIPKKIMTACGIIVIIFVFITCVFTLYNFLVKREQRKIEEHGKKTGRIVRELFPSIVRHRLTNYGDSSKSRILDFLKNGSSTFREEGINDSLPIADIFPSTTIIFADIPGFSSWSSAHQPKDTFLLLESIFQEFDKIARKLKVFKVETIADCYVAVAGLPVPRDDHAIVMCQFALECQRKFNRVKDSLSETLDVKELRLRSGLHSGAVTGGVLRGEKTRFQLFGDTMNISSRMESTGEPARVQISQQTADLLTEDGKSLWFIPRDDLVFAKGKGYLQTYWLLSDAHIRDIEKEMKVELRAKSKTIAWEVE